MRKRQDILISTFSVIVIVLVWALVAKAIDLPVIVPGPIEVLKSMIELFKLKTFFNDIILTVLRALESFVIIVIVGSIFGIIAGNFKVVEMIIKPLVTLFKAIPVMSIILIAFLWFKTGQIPVFSAFLMAFPVMYVQTLEGMKHRSIELEQMCKVYEVEGKKKLVNVTIPEMMPALITGAKQSLSMIWKVVIAAEVLTLPNYGIGKSLHIAQIQLETAGVFAWTVVAIVLTYFGDLLFAIILKNISKRGLK